MALEDDVRKCCDEAEKIRERASRIRDRCREEAQESYSQFEKKLERFLSEVREVRDKLSRGTREGAERFVERWKEIQGALHAHLLLVEAKGFLVSARRLAAEEDFVAAQNELAAAIRDVQEAQRLLPAKSEHLQALLREIESVRDAIRTSASDAHAEINRVVRESDRLLQEIGEAA